jgi:Mg/Co/Ni transporter MgtE
MLRERIREFMKSLQIGKILMAVSCAAAVCLWVKQVDISAFVALVMSAMIFFGVYVLVLAVLKEQFMRDIIGQLQKGK